MKEKEETSKAGSGVEVDAWMERLRERLEPRPALEMGREVPACLADPQPDLATLHETSEVWRPELASHRKIFGRSVLFVKRLLLRFLTPSLELQARHNTATTRLLTHFALRLESLEQQVELLSSRLAAGDEDGPSADE